VFMQLSRCLFMCVSLVKTKGPLLLGFIRITVWLTGASIFWVLGAFADLELRFLYWGLALCIETLAAMLGFWVPLIGKSESSDWEISGAHMAERCGLFIIISLGESLLVTGSTFSDLNWTLVSVSAFIIAFLGTVAMWWIYFSVSADCASEKIAMSENPGAIGRMAYSYLHIPIVAGIILVVVTDELILKHSFGHGGHTEPITLIALIGGPILFLLGNALFKKSVFGYYPSSHLFGVLFLVLLIPSYSVLVPIYLAGISMVILFMVGILEYHSVNKTRS